MHSQEESCPQRCKVAWTVVGAIALALLLAHASLASPSLEQLSAGIRFDIPPTYPVAFASDPDPRYGQDLGQRRVFSADLDSKAGPDLVVVGLDSVAILVNRGDGSFAEGARFELGLAQDCVAFADVDGDGRADLVAMGSDGQGTALVIRRGQSGMNFAPAERESLTFAARQLATADMDGDGDLDLVAGDSRAGSLWILRNDGIGHFSAAVAGPLPAEPICMVVADFNADGLPDIAVGLAMCCGGDNSLYVLPNVGGGTLGAPRTIALPESPLGLAAVTSDPGAGLDLAVLSYLHVYLLRGVGDGSFGDPMELFEIAYVAEGIYANSYSSQVLASDIDGDGRSDLVFLNTQPCFFNERAFVWVASGLEGGAFGDPRHYFVPPGPQDFTVVDVDSDGHKDVVVMARGQDATYLFDYPPSGASVLRNRGDGSLAAMLERQIDPHAFGGWGPAALRAARWRRNSQRDLLANSGNAVYVLLNEGRDAYRDPQALGGGILRTIADLNGDGLDEAFVSEGDSTLVWKSRGDGSLDWSEAYRCGSWIGLGDLDGDGWSDLVLRQPDGALVRLPGHGDARFGAPETLRVNARAGACAWAVGDLNNDGRADLAYAVHADTDTLLVLIQEPGGAWLERAVVPLPVPANYGGCHVPTHIVMADMDADGRVDLVALCGGNAGADCGGELHVVRAQPDGAFLYAAWAYPGNTAADIRVADLNRDGYPEVISVYSNGLSQFHFMFLENDGTGVLLEGVSQRVSDIPSDLDVADLDGDGLPDVVTSSPRYTSLTFVRNASGPQVPTATLLSLVAWHAEPGGVLLEWYSAEPLAGLLSLERRSKTAAAWVEIARLERDPSGYVRYNDRSVVPGGRYAYRLRGGAGASMLTDDTWINVPAIAALALRAVYPNPVAGDALVSFMLPAAAMTAFEVVDVMGRVVAGQRLGIMNAGEHAVRLVPRGTSLRPGMYFLRLEVGNDSRNAHFVVLR